MGAVKRETKTSEGLAWEVVNFSHKDSVKGLLKNRVQFDLLFKRNTSHLLYESHMDICKYEYEILCTYADLDELIKTTALSDRQMVAISLLQEGYSIGQIARKMCCKQPTVTSIIDAACTSISKTAHKKWLLKVYKNVKKTPLKKCACCGDVLPESDKFFYIHNKNEDKITYKGKCIECEKKLRRERNAS